MGESAEIAPETREYKTPSYIRAAAKRYRDKHPDIIKSIQTKYRQKKIAEHDEKYYNMRNEINKSQYKKKKEKGITPEEKAARAKYMREYRARKKAEKQTS
jgi:hypothetical protein